MDKALILIKFIPVRLRPVPYNSQIQSKFLPLFLIIISLFIHPIIIFNFCRSCGSRAAWGTGHSGLIIVFTSRLFGNSITSIDPLGVDIYRMRKVCTTLSATYKDDFPERVTVYARLELLTADFARELPSSSLLIHLYRHGVFMVTKQAVEVCC